MASLLSTWLLGRFSRRYVPSASAAMPTIDVYSPLPLQGAEEALALRPPVLGRIAFAGVVLGGCGCFAMCVYATVVSYPFIVAGRPLFSWPYFIIPSFASAMAVGAVAVAAGMLFLDRLPRLNHPAFNIEGIDGVTQDRMFLIVEARSDDFDPAVVEHTLRALPERPRRMQRVPR
jgi:MFS family permease